MKSAYVICILLGITISSLVLADGTAQIRTQSETTTSVPLAKTNDSTTVSTDPTTKSTPNTTTSSTTTPNTTATPNTTTPTPSTPSTLSTTPSTIPTPTKAPNTTVSPTKPSVAPTTSTPESSTTPVPSPSKDRHFDGLSFFGGIILATCLMAIAVFSWKFYRQCNQENYRTL